MHVVMGKKSFWKSAFPSLCDHKVEGLDSIDSHNGEKEDRLVPG
jgi:hypothetical protein